MSLLNKNTLENSLIHEKNERTLTINKVSFLFISLPLVSS